MNGKILSFPKLILSFTLLVIAVTLSAKALFSETLTGTGSIESGTFDITNDGFQTTVDFTCMLPGDSGVVNLNGNINHDLSEIPTTVEFVYDFTELENLEIDLVNNSGNQGILLAGNLEGTAGSLFLDPNLFIEWVDVEIRINYPVDETESIDATFTYDLIFKQDTTITKMYTDVWVGGSSESVTYNNVIVYHNESNHTVSFTIYDEDNHVVLSVADISYQVHTESNGGESLFLAQTPEYPKGVRITLPTNIVE